MLRECDRYRLYGAGQSMTDQFPLCLWSIDRSFGLVVMLENKTVANHMLSRWHCMVDDNLMAPFCVHNYINLKKSQTTGWNSAPPTCFTDVCRHSLCLSRAFILQICSNQYLIDAARHLIALVVLFLFLAELKLITNTHCNNQFGFKTEFVLIVITK